MGEIRNCLETDTEQKDADEKMQHVRDFIGINIEGWVSNEEFEDAKERVRIITIEMIDEAESDEERKKIEELWPFQDHEATDLHVQITKPT